MDEFKISKHVSLLTKKAFNKRDVVNPYILSFKIDIDKDFQRFVEHLPSSINTKTSNSERLLREDLKPED
ncbi:hypothetical protein B4092_0950 [Bacillus licheniformis]|uniref:hypothetical protein n=1 Tax=Bacillus licheniformis TaxID=1402 RepID=UPI00077935B0|nr:hypothetical protein [Bacillus licheniformis]KYC73111.1 hypothetical protein B4092_0950 [Bacillus licheniformis]